MRLLYEALRTIQGTGQDMVILLIVKQDSGGICSYIVNPPDGLRATPVVQYWFTAFVRESYCHLALG